MKDFTRIQQAAELKNLKKLAIIQDGSYVVMDIVEAISTLNSVYFVLGAFNVVVRPEAVEYTELTVNNGMNIKLKGYKEDFTIFW